MSTLITGLVPLITDVYFKPMGMFVVIEAASTKTWACKCAECRLNLRSVLTGCHLSV